METKVKNRGWVKNVAIVFLAVLLVLTFFSNTIMNRSLPEVATKNILSGTITAKIRGTGTVSANSNYEVQLDQSRKIKTVLIKAGQEVSAGDILFVLSDADSDELEAAKETLKQLKQDYTLAMLDVSKVDYIQENREIQDAQEALEKAEKAMTANTVTEEDVKAAEEHYQAAQSEYNRLNEEYKELEKQFQRRDEDVEDSTTYKSLKAKLAAAEETLAAAEETLKAAEDALATAKVLYGKEYDELVAMAREEFDDIVSQFERHERDYANTLYRRYIDQYRDLKTGTEKYDFIIDYYLPYVETRLKEIAAQTSASAEETTEESEPEEWDEGSMLNGVVLEPEQASAYLTAYTIVKNAQDAYDAAKAPYDTAAEAVDAVEDEMRQFLIVDNDNQMLKAAQERVDRAQTWMDEAKASLDSIQEKLDSQDTMQSNLKQAQRRVEDALKALEDKQKSSNRQSQSEYYNLENYREKIEKQEKLVEELTTDTSASEVTAQVSGVVQSVNITAGQTASAKETIATIEIPDMGYTMSFSVTNEQSRRVHIGDVATVSNYYYGSEITAELTGIKTDPQNPQSSKILTFDVRGDVSVGQSLTISIGARNQEYDYIVPNSALRSDSNGDFILIVVAQNSPLGNKYIATRVDVTIIASDDTNTAITGGVERNDFVITTSTKPISNGDRVRMADSLSG